MISDSPYDSAELVLAPWHGIVAGVAGAAAMLIVLLLLNPVAQLSPAGVLRNIGALTAPAGAAVDAQLAAGLALHLTVAGILGLLYALSQRLIPDRGLIGVGLLFGLVIWIVGSVIVGRLLPPQLGAMLRSWPWLMAHLAFGLVLAAIAVWQAGRRRREKRPAIVRD
ncbi:MAG: DUF6789 family protein [Anaerolineae bacterium]